MRHTNLALALLTAAVLTACGGNGSKPGDQTLKTKFSSMVTFGDSLADVGSYAVGGVAALGGGKFTINGDNTAKDPTLTGKNWTELVSTQLGLGLGCAAQTGLIGSGTFAVPVTNHAGCFNYAQGGARVTSPYGNGNPAIAAGGFAMTVPVVQQVANHLAVSGGKFSGTELVTVTAGGNDILVLMGGLSAAATAAGSAAGATAFATSLTMQLAAGATNPATAAQAIGLAIQTEAANPAHTDTSVVTAGVTAAVQAGNAAAASPAVYGPMVAKAQADATAAGTKAGTDYFAANAPGVVTAMATAGTELANLVKTQIVGKGATKVVVNNLPDIASIPASTAQSADVRAVIANAVDAFNKALSTGVAGQSQVLYVDLWTISHDQVTNPGPYGLTNTKIPACGPNALGGSSLVCNGSNLIAGDVSHYMFADPIHPTPYEGSLIARYVFEQMVEAGWL